MGRHIAKAAIAAGNKLTFFNRGNTDDSLFPQQDHLRGDRDGKVDVLAGVNAEIVIDTSGYTPDAVRASAIAVAGTVRHYFFVSSVDAYDLSVPVIDESSPTRSLPDDATTSERIPELYGAHKVRCERDLMAILGPERVVVVRAGLMVGPYDATDRFTYWVARVARGGEILAPRDRDMSVQLIDVRDVADWIVNAMASNINGVFNLVGNPGALAMGDVLDARQHQTQSNARFTWVPDEFLLAHDVGPWVEMPLWLPDTADVRGLRNVRNDAARASGLRLRSLKDTVRDTLAEYRSRPEGRLLRAGLSPQREAALLEAWNKRDQSRAAHQYFASRHT